MQFSFGVNKAENGESRKNPTVERAHSEFKTVLKKKKLKRNNEA